MIVCNICSYSILSIFVWSSDFLNFIFINDVILVFNDYMVFVTWIYYPVTYMPWSEECVFQKYSFKCLGRQGIIKKRLFRFHLELKSVNVKELLKIKYLDSSFLAACALAAGLATGVSSSSLNDNKKIIKGI